MSEHAAIAHHHRVDLPVYRSVRELTGQADATMRACALATLQRGERMLRKAVLMHDVLEGAGLRALFVRGPVLAHRCFNEAGAWRSDDLDLMVAPGEVHAAMEHLQRLGYRVMEERLGSTFELGLSDGAVLVAADGLLVSEYSSMWVRASSPS